MDHIIIKLLDGTDIIGRIIDRETEKVTIDNPMRIVYLQKPEGIVASLLKYAYFVEQEVFEFDKKFIVQAMTPRPEFAEYYEDIVLDQYERSKQKEDEALMGAKEDDMEMFQAMMELSTSNTSIH
jgi:hypothetical protein